MTRLYLPYCCSTVLMRSIHALRRTTKPPFASPDSLIASFGFLLVEYARSSGSMLTSASTWPVPRLWTCVTCPPLPVLVCCYLRITSWTRVLADALHWRFATDWRCLRSTMLASCRWLGQRFRSLILISSVSSGDGGVWWLKLCRRFAFAVAACFQPLQRRRRRAVIRGRRQGCNEVHR